MLVVIVAEAKKNFAMLNLRQMIVTQSQAPRLMEFLRIIKLRKRLIAAITLVALNYFILELFYHGAWDLFLLEKYSSDIRNQLALQIVHESTDLLTVFLILLIINISSAF
jgi:hypothetical protein